jgi:hypothetical protein
MKTGRVPSLKDLCLREVSRNLDGLSDLGDVPFALIKSAFTHVSAAKLTELERVNQWPAELCLDLWARLVARDFGKRETSTTLTTTSSSTRSLLETLELQAQSGIPNWKELYRDLEREKKDKLDKVKSKLAGVYKKAEDRKSLISTIQLTNVPVRRGKHGDNGVKKATKPPLFAKALKQAKQATR